MRFGQRLKEARERKGLSQSELARRCGVSRELITNVEAGRRTMSIRNARTIARELGVGLDWLAGTFEDSELEPAVA
jgi:transcriptional regulator with XRE-family HTH domain